ncbi:hypothetical protein NDU88_007387 [Pleurodeles waltl]|uniref:Secreted protein n=1 Tax=Pleurodeles waltl TaxID=8319 RepID=A0AAV7NUT4_PLEWA|nr:hypothetical protein NDU88_007387 [Pleurodeles waltl]
MRFILGVLLRASGGRECRSPNGEERATSGVVAGALLVLRPIRRSGCSGSCYAARDASCTPPPPLGISGSRYRNLLVGKQAELLKLGR